MNLPSEPGPRSLLTEWLIGGGEDCAHRIASNYARVAILSRRDGRLFIRDLGSGEAVHLNGLQVPPAAEWELTRHDILEIARTTIEIEPRFFTADAVVGLATTRLTGQKDDGSGTLLCCDVFIRARPGTLTAIMGPSGCGKTVFLNLLNGYTRPASGRVIIGRRFDLHRDFERVRDLIGFVPQDDVMTPELTVRQSLHYRLQLRFPGMAHRVQVRLTRQTCVQLGFPDDEIDRFLDKPIDTTELERRGLSGGERKRANIAHELLGRPSILILDEPTSGLSSADADQMMRMLKALASEDGLTVIASVHQPGQAAFAQFDNLVVMADGGRIAYYGPAGDAAGFFEQATEDPIPGTGSVAEYILRQVHRPQDADRVVRHYLGEAKRLGLPAPLEDGEAGTSDAATNIRVPHPRQHLRQCVTLLRRNLDVLRADRASFRLALWQVPFMAILIWFAGYHVDGDGASLERFTRMLHQFHQRKTEDSKLKRPIRIEAHAFEAVQQSEHEDGWISRAVAQRRGGVVFVLVAAATWLGIMGGCREIAAEKQVLRRECRTCLSLLPYLGAKLLSLTLVTGLQCAALVILVVPWLLGYSPAAVTKLWGVLWLGAIASSALGLMISAFAANPRSALTAVPILMIPQLLFGGVLRPQVDIPEGVPWPRIMGALTIQRWVFEPALALDDSPQSQRVMMQDWGKSPETMRDMWNLLQFQQEPGDIVTVHFPPRTRRERLVLPIGVLILGTGMFVLLSHFHLRRQIFH